MRWPWEKKDNMKKIDVHDAIAPAQEEVNKSHARIDRINRILLQADKAESIVKKQNMR